MAFQLNTIDRAVIYRRPTGRLMRPSDRMIATHGLGEVDGILDTLKNFGSGVVQAATLGLYDPRKNRFYVPFSSGNVRNFLQGTVNASTLGLVKTDKFFGSQTVRTAGTVIGAVAAAGAVAATGYYGAKYFSTPSTAPGAPGSPTFGPPSPAAPASSTASLFSNVSLPSLKNTLDILTLTAKVAGSAGGGGGGGAPQQQQQGGFGGPVIVMEQPQATGQMITNPQYGYSFDPMSGMMLPAGGGSMYAGGGGGGGIGPPGSEYGSMEQQPVEQVLTAMNEMSLGAKLALTAGVGLVAYFVFLKK